MPKTNYTVAGRAKLIALPAAAYTATTMKFIFLRQDNMITGLSGYNKILSKKIKTEFHSAMSIIALRCRICVSGSIKLKVA
ncbi:MAG: hypothetical protein LBJ00_16600 [Planctomycetaceae bacterium]|nr:hypothetical protein [Planctomycetaceae bacterium]